MSQTLRTYTLDDRYTKLGSPSFCSGLQAIVRMVLVQHQLDQKKGRVTRGFISGYRGSPLGGLDQQLWQARQHLDARGVVFQPGLNEDLAATAVWGSQQVGFYADPQVQGVFGLWYGKGPGVDRSGDVFKHANHAGTSPWGGVVALVGDDHAAKSSSLPHQSDYVLMGAGMPILAPSTVQEIIDYGLFGWALSRFSGCWVGMKLVSDTVEASSTLMGGVERYNFLSPKDAFIDPLGGAIRLPDSPIAQEERLQYKLGAAQAFVRLNGLDSWIMGSPLTPATLGIITAGKSYHDVLQALDFLGLSLDWLANKGVRLYKVGMIWPLEPQGIKEFCGGLKHVIVIEEKASLIEGQVKTILYNLPGAHRPAVWGKNDPDHPPAVPRFFELDVPTIAKALLHHLKAAGIPDLDMHLKKPKCLDLITTQSTDAAAIVGRVPYYCAGCPHNRSTTHVPAGSKALAGIGCHYMALWITPHTHTFTQMGGEGVPWIGAAPFCGEGHVFANMGDGTYYHSGLLAIRQSVAAHSNITYKILYNDAVAMTGGQPVDGPISVPRITHQVAAEGVEEVVVVTDDIYSYPLGDPMAHGTNVYPRSELDAVQQRLKSVPGTTVLIYDQTCAAENRRRRRRGMVEDPPKRVFINPSICEGCGDCGKVSNCVAIQPLETEFGTKRRIDQSTCNKDYSCIEGFCPSFITMEGAWDPVTQTPSQEDLAQWVLAGLKKTPKPKMVPFAQGQHATLVAGIGGTGMTTIGALLGTAAHLDRHYCTVMDQTGLAQKGGTVYSHIKIAAEPHHLHAHKIGALESNVVLACDILSAAQPWALSTYHKGVTHVILNSDVPGHANFVHDGAFKVPFAAAVQKLESVVGAEAIHQLPAHALSEAALGDALYMNSVLLGYGYQKGLLPVTEKALLQTIVLNGVAIEANTTAFGLGRIAAADPDWVYQTFLPQNTSQNTSKDTLPGANFMDDLDALVAHRTQHLIAYQDALYGFNYQNTVRYIESVEESLQPGSTKLTKIVAHNYHKVLAYKDEYEIARLYAQTSFLNDVRKNFNGPVRLNFYLAPPLFRSHKRNERPKKYTFGPGMLKVFGILAKGKRWRGTWLDIFGYTAERRQERQLIALYQQHLGLVAKHLRPENYEVALLLLSWPDHIKGFGPVKEAAIQAIMPTIKDWEKDFRATFKVGIKDETSPRSRFVRHKPLLP